ncbi:MAG TPA: acetoin dehydrogenase dihydrolipoyllysine-residue acetyltransferase subunit [Roseiarcus sp.]|jgi:pyruvate dehydrogenase E2 component (dihydrolipoamide acetyltransferase)
MAVEVILPRVDMDMTTGKLTQWFVAEGERVEKGQPLFEIETDKAAMEIEAAASGVLRAVTAKPGDQLPVGTVVGVIVAPNEDYSAAGVSAPARAVAPAPFVAAPAESLSPDDRAPRPAGERSRMTPAARRVARESGVEVAHLVGSGPHGRIQARDVAARGAPALAEGALNRLWLARGQGRPLAFLHGFGADLNGWRPLVGRLRPGRPLLALDLPGHGLSPLGADSSFEALVEAVEATLVEEGVGDVHLIGHSLGGAVAIALAKRRGKSARSLTLISPAGLGPEVNGDFLAGFLRAESERSLAPWMRLLANDEGALGSAMVKTTIRQRRERDIAAAQRSIAATLFPDGAQAISLRETLANYAGPVKVIFGLDDRIIPARHARGLSGLVALHLFPGVGHMPHFEARSEIARLVEENVAAGE